MTITQAALSSAVHLSHTIAPHDFDAAPTETVERKGAGHPDTLADALGEHLSVNYARHTLARFGYALHHQFDKVGILGGRVRVSFGGGELLEPVRVLLNGRASASFASEPIPVKDLVSRWTREFFAVRFPMLDVERDLRLFHQISTGDSPGGVGPKTTANRRSRWFAPAGPEDLPELTELVCNDTSSGAAYAPLTRLEQYVRDVEFVLAGDARPDWLGSDIKTMAVRDGSRVRATMCIPQLAAHVTCLTDYLDNLGWARHVLEVHARELLPGHQVQIDLNMRDDLDRPELYLTFTGSSIETGDEGLVGRGNRYGGLISANRPFTMEGISGKNPVYHTGKVYSVGAGLIAEAIWQRHRRGAQVVIVGQTGQPITAPHAVLISTEPGPADLRLASGELERLVAEHLAALPHTVPDILAGRFPLH